jgi:hypothetical protein
MRLFLSISAVLLSVSASATPPSLGTSRALTAPAGLGLPGTAPPPSVLRDRGEATDPRASQICRDRIEAVRDERGLPKLSRDNTAPAEPLLIAAVDKRIGGCSVLVMRNNTNDIHPLPQFQDGPPKLTPLKGQ